MVCKTVSSSSLRCRIDLKHLVFGLVLFTNCAIKSIASPSAVCEPEQNIVKEGEVVLPSKQRVIELVKKYKMAEIFANCAARYGTQKIGCVPSGKLTRAFTLDCWGAIAKFFANELVDRAAQGKEERLAENKKIIEDILAATPSNGSKGATKVGDFLQDMIADVLEDLATDAGKNNVNIGETFKNAVVLQKVVPYLLELFAHNDKWQAKLGIDLQAPEWQTQSKALFVLYKYVLPKAKVDVTKKDRYAKALDRSGAPILDQNGKGCLILEGTSVERKISALVSKVVTKILVECCKKRVNLQKKLAQNINNPNFVDCAESIATSALSVLFLRAFDVARL